MVCYAIIRKFIVPCAHSDDAIAFLFATLKLDGQAIHQLAEVLADPCALHKADLPLLTQYTINLHYESTFFDVEGCQLFGSANMGSRPGHPFAD